MGLKFYNNMNLSHLHHTLFKLAQECLPFDSRHCLEHHISPHLPHRGKSAPILPQQEQRKDFAQNFDALSTATSLASRGGNADLSSIRVVDEAADVLCE
jgi:hypothetical protein